MEAIRFAHDYNRMDARLRSKWIEDAYMRAFPRNFQGMDDQARKKQLQADKREYNYWKKGWGWKTMARNRLYTLFIEASYPTHYLLMLTITLSMVQWLS